MKLQETTLYLPIKEYLEKTGYKVKGEIKNCDIVAIKNNQLLVVELKLSLNITLLLQAVDRFSLSDIVYIAIPKQCPLYKKKTNQVKKLMARLGIGLIVVDFAQDKQAKNKHQKIHHYVEVVSDPNDHISKTNKRKQDALLKEFSSRIGDPQVGGSTSRKIGLTAYRQRCIRIAEYLSKHGKTKGSKIKNALAEPQATNILYQNYYQWFTGIGKGVYQLSEKGHQDLLAWTTTKMES